MSEVEKKKKQVQETTETARRLARLSAFEEVSRSIGASLDLSEICHRALYATVQVVGARAGIIYMVDWADREIRAIAFSGFDPEFCKEFGTLPLNERSLTGKAILLGKPQVGTGARLPPIGQKVVSMVGTRNLVVVPISSRGKILGSLNLVLPSRRKLSADEVELITNIAAPIGVAMDNAELHAEAVDLNAKLMHTSLRLQSLLNAAEDISSRLELGEVLHRIVELASHMTNATKGLVALRENDHVVTREWWDGRHWRPFEYSWQKGQGGPGWAEITREPYLSNEAESDPHTVPELLRVMQLRNYIVAPMLSREGEFLGVVEVDNKAAGEAFTGDDVELVVAFSRLAAVALQNARLFRDVNSIKNLLQTMIDNAAAYIIYLDAKFIMRRVSRKSAAFFGMQPEELLGKNVFDVLPWLRELEVAERLEKAMATGRRQEKREVRLSLPDRPESFWDVAFVPTKDRAGQVEGILSYSTDITDKVRERKAAEERAQREQAIAEVALAVNSEAALQDVLRVAVKCMVEALPADGGAIYLREPSGRRLHLVISEHMELPADMAALGLRDIPVTRRVFKSRRPAFVGPNETSQVARHFLERLGIARILIVPLIAAGKPIGVVYVSYNGPHSQPSAEEMDFAISLASQCAIAIERARLLEEARTQRERLELVIQQMPEGVVVAEGPGGCVALLNQRAREIVGKGLKVGTPISRIPEQFGVYHPDGRLLRPEDMALYRALYQGQATRGIEVLIRRPHQKQIAALVGAAPLRDASGRIREAVLVIQDTTPLKEAQEQAEEAAHRAERQKAELETIIETLAEGLIIFDASGNILRMNSSAKRLLGMEMPECIYKHIEDFRPLDLRDKEGRPLPLEEWPMSRAMRGEAFLEQEVMVTDRSGRRRHFLIGGSSVRNSKGQVVLSVLVFRDITAIRDLERQREEFISVIAHDLRAALTVVRGYVQILLTKEVQESMPVEAKRPLDAIFTSTKRLEKMIADLLDVSRIEARRLKLDKRPLDLATFIGAITERLGELTKGHLVRVEVRGKVPVVMADPDRLEQILSNLLSNAAKYSYPESPITIEVAAHRGEVIISVTNLGPGIKPADLPRLFTRFHRTETAVHEKVPGLGLGLYITKGLVEAHGGRIWVESEPNKYTIFRFTLPVTEPTKKAIGSSGLSRGN